MKKLLCILCPLLCLILLTACGGEDTLGSWTSVEGYQFSAQPIIFDSEKPGYWQVLNYQCDVRNLLNEENDEQD